MTSAEKVKKVARRSFGTAKRQQGAETVEFLFTFLLFLMVFFMIIDFAIAMYDQGTIINASRDGSRQASMYWVDPATFDPETPDQNQQLKRSMVDSVITWTENNLVIDPGSTGLTLTLQVNSMDMAFAVQAVSAEDVVSVGINYPHEFIGLSSLAGLPGLLLLAQSAVGVE